MKTVTIGKITWTKESIWELIRTNDAALGRAVLKIHSKQTAEEQAVRTTNKNNGMGFNAYDAEKLSEYADLLRRGKVLSVGQLAELRGRMKKYCNQLLNISIAEHQQERKAA